MWRRIMYITYTAHNTHILKNGTETENTANKSNWNSYFQNKKQESDTHWYWNM
jgi:hypothetical protein